MPKSSLRAFRTVRNLTWGALVLMLGASASAVVFLTTKPTTAIPTPPTAQSYSQQGNVIVGLGDSLTHGTGDPRVPAGYLPILQQELKKSTKNTTYVDLSVPGRQPEELRQSLQNQNSITNPRPWLALAQVVCLSIGGNALLKSGDADLSSFENTLTTTLKEIRSLTAAPIYLLGFYNVATGPPEVRAKADLVINAWEESLRKVSRSFPQTKVIPIRDLFYPESPLLAADGLHPNAEGYNAIAARILPHIPGRRES